MIRDAYRKPEDIKHEMSEEQYWSKIAKINASHGVDNESDLAYDNGMNATVIFDNLHYDVFTEESLDIYEAGLLACLEDMR